MTDAEEPKKDDSESEESSSESSEQEGPSQEEGPTYLDWEANATPMVMRRNGYIGNTIIVQNGDFVGSSDGETRNVTPTIDITASVKEFASDFVESPSFEDVCSALDRSRIALLVGKECGNRVSAGAALLQDGHAPILELSAGVAAPELVDAIEQACQAPRAGLLVDSVDTKTLSELAGFELRRLENVIPAGAALVFTARLSPPNTNGELPVIDGAPPDAEEVVRSFVQRQGISDDARDRALEAVRLLPGLIGPGRAVEIAERAAASQAEPADLAAEVGGRSPVLEEWLQEGPDAKALASLAAAAALDGAPSGDFEAAAAALAELLEGEVEPSQEPKRFGGSNRGWPEGIAGLTRRQIVSHFGWHETEVVEILAPHRRDVILSFLWRELGAEFREPFLDWLRVLCAMPSRRTTNAAASAAGVLFIQDPVAIDRELLHPWARDDLGRVREAAGLALGMPALMDADSNASRLLAQSWSRSSNERLQEAAIVAYGGPLGAWEPAAAAASHLWQMPRRNPALTEPANLALASLFAGGRHAERARATVVAMLTAASSARSEQVRAFAMLPILLKRISAGTYLARESLDGLFSDAEESTRSNLAALLAVALDAPTGHQFAREAILELLAAIAAGRINQEIAERVIREMKVAARNRGRLAQLGTQLERLLRAEARGEGPLSDVADSIHGVFYDQR